jgi:hypothetical protein
MTIISDQNLAVSTGKSREYSGSKNFFKGRSPSGQNT